jgi:glutathione S-transferase
MDGAAAKWWNTRRKQQHGRLAMPKVVLHQWEMSPFCNKTRRCLKFKGVEFTVVDYNGLLARKAAALTPVGKLPVIDWDGERVHDSTRIAHFLDDKIPKPRLYPTDPQELAAARLWEDWASQSLYFYEIYFRMLDPVSLERALDLVCKGRPRWERSVLKFVFQRRYPKKLAQQGLARMPRADVERAFFDMIDAIDMLLEGRAYLTGLSNSIGDISVAAQLEELVRTSDLAPQVLARPRLKAWLERVSA